MAFVETLEDEPEYFRKLRQDLKPQGNQTTKGYQMTKQQIKAKLANRLMADEISSLRSALDVLRRVKSRSTDDVGMFSDDNAIDCCERAIDGIIDLLDSQPRIF